MKAKKSLGQNFLKSSLALKKIIEAGEIKPDDVVLEIGPGRGALTSKLLEKAKTVIAVEKDNQLIFLLKEKFAEQISSGSLVLLHDDIMKFDVEQNVPERTLGRSDGDGQRKFSAENFRGESGHILRNYKIIANIPYNITGAILKKFLTERQQPESMILMVQHEVGRRIVASDKKESLLSISVKAYGEPKLIMKVPARYFSPAPKVDSAIISIKNISRKTFEENKTRPTEQSFGRVSEERFWEIVKAGFAHKRKKLSGNLKGILDPQKDPFLSFGDKRAEDLALLDWISLAN
jgi:16S rRNA (adenine1518-N6/adenine1519-N6)-dimethyltransferase